jgi:hypothetical protein
MLAVIGVIASSIQTGGAHLYAISLNTTTYYHDRFPIQQGDEIFLFPTGNAKISDGTTGIDDVDGDGNNDSWSISNNGSILWSMIIFHQFSIILGGTTYYHDNYPIGNGNQLYNGQGSGALPAAEASGLDDVNNDNNLDDWNINNAGIITWQTHISYPNSVFINGLTYYYDGNIVNGTTKMYTGPYSGDPVWTYGSGDYTTGNAYDWDGDGNLDTWVIGNDGTLHFYMYLLYSNTYSLYSFSNGNIIIYSDSSEFTQNMLAMNNVGTGAGYAQNDSGENYLDGDSDIDEWNINNGRLTWVTAIKHPYAVDLSIIGLFNTYIDTPTVENGSVVYMGQGSSAQATTYYSYGATSDINGDGIDETWYINGGGAIVW